MKRSNLTLCAASAALAFALVSPAVLAQSQSVEPAPAMTQQQADKAAPPPMTDSASGMQASKAEQERQRALRADTSANAIAAQEKKEAADKAREKGQPVEEEEEGTP